MLKRPTTQISDMDNSLFNKDKEVVHIKRAFESVHSRLHPKNNEQTNDIDVQVLVSQCLDKLSEREAEVVALRADVQALRQSLAGRSKEQKFKANNPPPPPPMDRRKVTISKGSEVEPSALPETVKSSEVISPQPPPPPPPPPGPVLPILSLSSPDSLTSSSPPPPPPPPTFGSDFPPPPPPPPPIAGGVVPLPPPPPSMPHSSLSPRPAIYTRSKPKQSGPRLKPFFWNKLDNNAVGATVWSEPLLVSEYKMDDLEVAFTIDATPQTPSRAANFTGKQNITTLLETTRANNMGRRVASRR